MSTLQAIKYERGSLKVLDQLLLPHQTKYDEITTCEEAFDCIKAMRVRGAPAIAIVAALALAVELENKFVFGSHGFSDMPVKQQVKYIYDKLAYLKRSRPTAVDLGNAIKLLKKNVDTALHFNHDIKNAYIESAEKILGTDHSTNLAIGRYGAEYLRRDAPTANPDTPSDSPSHFTTSPPGTQGAIHQMYRKISVLTHCNTGSLATSGHGTALGIIRSLHKMNYLEHAYCTETRPYNQGSRLTAYELVHENIPSTLITDSMAAALFLRYKTEKNISAVIVGADRVARNGDTANKIGTYSLAVLARYHGIKFIVAAPCTTIDFETPSGKEIKIEKRPSKELTQISGPVVDENGNVVDAEKSTRIAIAHQGIDVWNPSFDVTPRELIDAIITERGEVEKDEKGRFEFWKILSERWESEVGTLSDGVPCVEDRAIEIENGVPGNHEHIKEPSDGSSKKSDTSKGTTNTTNTTSSEGFGVFGPPEDVV